MLINHKVPYRYILNSVKYRLTYVLVFSVLVYFLTVVYNETLPDIPLAIPAFIGTAISVLLSFKLNQSYDRWWEARKIWGSIVNDSRNLVLQLQALSVKGDPNLIKKMGHRQIAWTYALSKSLREKDPMPEASKWIDSAEIAELGDHNNKALALLQFQGRDLAKLRESDQLDSFGQVQINSTITRLCDAMGMAERIKNTVFPITYRLYLMMIIYLFIALLSISLREMELYFQLPLSLLISSIFLLLEKTSTSLQDPFEDRPSDVPLNAISRTIEINLKQLLKEKEVPAPFPSYGFYLD
ncbi:bestrophin family protein [Lunatibacter salilacus]|uniref:bestrophin family protein n=1 Tax=Lunatibacter salilacus TaxID=2483804 RepID=UPI00131A7AEF|nr:bestrophin family ion channel [Lunatibacter salilacus]